MLPQHIEITSKHSPEDIAQIIAEQLQREKMMKVYSESPEKTLCREKFLSSKLVNKQRIYGVD